MEPTPGGQSPVLPTKRPLQDITNTGSASHGSSGSESSVGGSQKSQHPKAPRHPVMGDSFSTPVGPSHTLPMTPGFTPRSEAMRKKESLHKTNTVILERLARRQQTESALKRTLAAQLENYKDVGKRLGKQLCQSQAELSLRTSMTNTLLSSVPGAQLDQLERKDRQISDLEREVAQLKERLVSAEAGLTRVAYASGTSQPQGADPEALAAILENSIKANQAESEVLRNAVQDMKSSVISYQRHCQELQEKAVALEALGEEKKETIRQQGERLSDLEAEMANARSNSWQHSEQVSQLVEAMQQAQATIGQQSKTISQNKQEMALLQTSLETAEYCLEEAQARLRMCQAAPPDESPHSAASS